MSGLRRHLLPVGLSLLVACNNPPTGETPAHLVAVVGPPDAGVPGWVLIDTIMIQAVDPAGNPRSGVPITWLVAGGGGSVEVLDDRTDAEGVARARWTLGPGFGPNALRASTLDEASITFETEGAAFQVDKLASGFDLLGCGLVGGALWCWGDSFWASSPPVSDPEAFGWVNIGPGVVDDTRDYVDLAVSGQSVCGLVSQDVWCAGENAPQPARVAGLPSVRRIVGAGFAFQRRYCALATADSTAWCWEGHPATAPPAQVPSSPTFTDLWMESGFRTTLACGVLADSTAACWGDGPLGDGSIDPSTTPVAVSGGHRFAELAVGDGFACGRKANGEVWCWGRDYGEFGMALPDILQPALATTGAFRITAGLLWAQLQRPGDVVRWGGAGFSPVSRRTGLAGLPVAAFATNDLTCARLVDGQVLCLGEMFDNSTTPRDNEYLPVQPVRSP